MSISSIKSFSSVMYTGINSSVFTWFVDRTGVVQNIAKTTTPLLKGAFVFGAINGAVEYASTNLKKKVKRDWIPEGSYLGEGADVLQFALTMASRYAVKKLCNEYFGTKITNEFVHIYTTSDIIKATSSLGTPFLAIEAFGTAILAKVLSIFMATPLFKNAFYFGAINFAVAAVIIEHSPKIHAEVKSRLGLEDLRILYISHVALGVISLVSIYCSTKICNQYLNLNIPRNYTIFMVLLSLTNILPVAFLNHVIYDIFGADFTQIIERVRNSEDENLRAMANEITEIIENRDSLDWGTFWQRLQGRDFNNAFSNASILLVLEALKILSQFPSQWIRGNSIEDIFVKLLEDLADNRDAIDPLLNIFRGVTGVDSNQAGATFILEEVLKDASESTKEALSAIPAMV